MYKLKAFACIDHRFNINLAIPCLETCFHDAVWNKHGLKHVATITSAYVYFGPNWAMPSSKHDIAKNSTEIVKMMAQVKIRIYK